MKNLYKFDTVTNYNDKEGNLPYINVSYVSENDTVYYTDEKSEIEQQPLTVKIIALPNETYCRFWFKSDPEENDQTTFVKYRINNGDWVDATYLYDIEIDDCQLNDEIQIIADWRRGLQSIAVWKNGSRGEAVEGAKVKMSGNWFSTVNGYDYATNPFFDKRGNDDFNDNIHRIAGESSFQIADISDIWIPTRCLKYTQYNKFYSELSDLTGTTDIRLVVSDDSFGEYGAFYQCCYRSNITTGTIGTDHAAERSFFQTFNESAITTLTIEKLDRDLNNEIAASCSNLTTVYNYTNHYVKLTDNFNNMPQSGTLYYVDYGQDMAYTPSSMVPSGWTCTPIQNPNI